MIHSKTLVGMATAIVMATVTLPAAAANDLQYDIQDQRNSATFKQLVWDTRSCMNEGARGMLVQGVRDSSAIATFVQKVCGGSLSGFMTKALQRPVSEAATFIQAMAYNGFNRILGLSRSNSSSNSTKQPERDAAYTIFTFKSGQRIGTRKIEVAELRNNAISLISAFQEETPSYEALVSVAKDLTAKERCFNLYGSRVAIALVDVGIFVASQYAETFLKNSISSIEAVNSQTQVTCEMHKLRYGGVRQVMESFYDLEQR